MSSGAKLTKHLGLLGSRGDTIVEVLLAIAVVSAVLGGAYVSANRSFANTRRSQERSEAGKYVEGQLERLKQAFPANPGNFPDGGPAFCLDDSLVKHTTLTDPPCNQGGDSRYRLSIQRSGNDFAAQATWPRFGGGGQEEVKIVYRLYQ